MKRNVKKALIVTHLMLLSTLLTGCFENEKVQPKKLEVLDTIAKTQLDFEHEFEGIKLKSTYSAGDYDIKKWLITDSKSLNMRIDAESLPEETEILVEHVHADVSLVSKLARFNRMPQDSMDDTYHGVAQDGLWISKQYPYEEIFAIEGFSETLINGWAHVYGGGYISEQRITERSLVEYGEVFGNKIQVVYNLNVKHKGEKYYHTKTIKDEFYIVTTYVSPVKNDK